MLQRLLDEADARQLPALIAEWSERSDALHWIARALQLDLSLLIERPELVLTCLYRRCAWFADREVFYPQRGDVPREAESVGALVQEWIAARPRRWLRALRPSRFTLDAGIVEEYRSSLEGEVRFSADSSIVGVVGKTGDTVGWERVTGRKIDARGKLDPPAASWCHQYEKARIVLLSADRRCDLAVDEGETVFTAVDLGGDLVLAQSWYEADPYDDFHTHAIYLVDAAAARIVWRVEGEGRSAVRVGETIVTSGDAIVTRSLATGEALSTHPFKHSYSAVFSPDGRVVATRDGAVVQVWDVAQIAAVVPCRVRGGVLSPDDTRILADTVLVDARTGAVIANVPLYGRGMWQEGGPPSNAWELVDHIIVQAMPWEITVWDSADGRQVAQFQVHSGVRDTVCNDPRGRYIALFHHPDRLTVFEARTGATLFETTAQILEPEFRKRIVGFSESGDELWWQTDAGSFAVPTSTWAPIRAAPVPERPSRFVDVPDGLLVVGDVAAPIDSAHVQITADGTIFVGADHYLLDD